MKVQIVKLFEDFGNIGYNHGCYWSPGIVSLATSVRVMNPDVDIEMIDGTLEEELDSVKERIDPDADLIGFSVDSSNYVNSLSLAKFVKLNGSGKVIFGGVHPTILGREVMSYQNSVDFVIRHKGEIPLNLLIMGEDYCKIPNLVWRKNGSVISNPIDLELRMKIDLDLSFLEYEKYAENHEKTSPHLPQRPYVILTHDGCTWRNKSGGCTFCSIQSGPYHRQPESIWEEVRTAIKRFQVGYIRDYGDDISGNLPWLTELTQKRPAEIDIPFFPYVSTRRVRDNQISKLLQLLNANYVFIGFESANNAMLKALHKGCTVNDHLRAVKLLSQVDIGIYGSYVLGAPGETKESLEDTYDFVKRISEIANVPYASASSMVPFPGSKAFNDLAGILPNKYCNKDYVDLKEAMMDWADIFCPDLGKDRETRFEILREYELKINEFSPIKSYYLPKPV